MEVNILLFFIYIFFFKRKTHFNYTLDVAHCLTWGVPSNSKTITISQKKTHFTALFIFSFNQTNKQRTLTLQKNNKKI